MKIEKLIKILDAEEKRAYRRMVKVSSSLLSDSFFDIKTYLQSRMAKVFALEVDAIITGKGVKPIPRRMLRGKSPVAEATKEIRRLRRKQRR